jgi:hypothetical protein
MTSSPHRVRILALQFISVSRSFSFATTSKMVRPNCRLNLMTGSLIQYLCRPLNEKLQAGWTTTIRLENLNAGSPPFVISYPRKRVQSFHQRRAATIYMSPMPARGVCLKPCEGTKLKFYVSTSDIDCTEVKRIGGDCSIYSCILAYASKRLALRIARRQGTRRERYTRSCRRA